MNLEEKFFLHSIFEISQNCLAINKIRLQALARKAIRQGYEYEEICLLLAEDSYLKEIYYKFGYTKAYSLLENIIKKAQS